MALYILGDDHRPGESFGVLDQPVDDALDHISVGAIAQSPLVTNLNHDDIVGAE
jgi:hypothetical protein